MKEREWMIVRNHGCIRHALSILIDVIPGVEYGVTKDELHAITMPLAELQERYYGKLEVEDDET